MKTKEKGFTLIELLAVIVVLAILALIAIPVVVTIINDARNNSYKRSIESYVRAIEYSINEYRIKYQQSETPLSIKELEDSVGINYKGDTVICEDTFENNDGKIILNECQTSKSRLQNKDIVYNYNNGKITEDTLVKQTEINASNWNLSHSDKVIKSIEVSGSFKIMNYSNSDSIASTGSYNKNSSADYLFLNLNKLNKKIKITIECLTSSESNYDFGFVYLGKKQVKPTSSQIRSASNMGNGKWIYRKSGTSSTYEVVEETFDPGEYVLSLGYAKDGSVNTGADRFFIKSIKIEEIK